MARSARTIGLPKWPGAVAALLVCALVLGPFIAVGLWAGGGSGFVGFDWAAVRFTLLQAALSALISVVAAIPIARALARRSFPGRTLLLTLLGAPFLLPVIVAVMGLLAVFGRNGLVNAALSWSGLPEVSIYGLGGILLAHVFLNLPLAVRIILQGWLDIPAERFRLAASLELPVWRALEIPMLRSVLPGAFAMIFLVCLTSFAVALTLGGGPAATTIEVAIYQALRFDFDLGKAALLALMQASLGIAAAFAALSLSKSDGLGAGFDRLATRWDSKSSASRLTDAGVIVVSALFLIVPLALVIGKGALNLADLPNVVPAALRSLAVATGATVITIVLGLAIATRGGRWTALASTLPLAFSGMVIGTGLFLLLFKITNPVALALPVTALMNALMALPFALRVLTPAVQKAELDFGRLADAVSLNGWARLRFLILPRVRRPLGFAAGLTAALSVGDLGVIVLFGTDKSETLPLLMYRLMGAYRTDQAAAVALVLLVPSLGLFWLFDRWGHRDADA